MVKRSLQASPLGIEDAKQAFAQKGWTQEELAWEVNLKTRQSVWRFFSGRPVERQVFIEICSALNLDWRKIAIDPPAEFSEAGVSGNAPKNGNTLIKDINVLVQQVRSQRQCKIQDQCGTLQLLNIARPVAIDNLYVDITALEEISSQQWLELSDLQGFTPQEFDRFALEERSQKIAGITAVKIYSKMRVLGLPGAGKTTFLQHLAIQCNRGYFAADRVPIFINLRDFADEVRETGESSLLSYIYTEFLTSGITEPSALETLLREGRVLLLLDGFDEVLAQDSKTVAKEIRRLSEHYQKNLFVVTCRTAAKATSFRRFTDVELAPLSQAQIIAFAQKWFTTIPPIDRRNGATQTQRFLEQLNLPENLPLRRLVVTPLFLHLACWIFHRQDKFPTHRAEFYKQCLDLLLGKWDEQKGIERDEIYRGFLLPQKLKLLSHIANDTFEQGSYFFKPQGIEPHLLNCVQGLTNAATNFEQLQWESEAILRAIELQHGILIERVQGIFSFSDLTFQEYFTARRIVTTYNLQLSEQFSEHPSEHPSEQALEHLVNYLTDPRWREIFLLTVTMLTQADALVQLMKQRIDAIVAQDQHLQELLVWANQRTLTPPHSFRAFYADLQQQQLSLGQQQTLQSYCEANQLLLDCLNSNCEITPGTRQQLEARLLLLQ
jgi:predicted NACHT family NTPase